MTIARRWTIAVGGLVVLLLVVGCQDPDKLQIEAQTERINSLLAENDRLAAENESLRGRLAQCSSDLEAARNRAYFLEQQNADLLKQLGERPEQTGPWREDARGFAWIDIGSDLLFGSGKSKLRAEARAELAKIVDDIKSSYADRTILIVGHTDADPIKVTKNLYKDNLDLSTERAASVFRELVSLGIEAERLVAGGQGEYNPVAPNDTKDGKSQNRRVVFFAVPEMPAQ